VPHIPPNTNTPQHPPLRRVSCTTHHSPGRGNYNLLTCGFMWLLIYNSLPERL